MFCQLERQERDESGCSASQQVECTRCTLCPSARRPGLQALQRRAVLTDLPAQKLARKAGTMLELVCLAILSTASLVSGLQVKGSEVVGEWMTPDWLQCYQCELPCVEGPGAKVDCPNNCGLFREYSDIA